MPRLVPYAPSLLAAPKRTNDAAHRRYFVFLTAGARNRNNSGRMLKKASRHPASLSVISPEEELCKIPLPIRERIKVRVLVSRVRAAHAACAIPHAALKCLRENALPAIFCRTLTASRCALGRLSQSGRGLGRAASLVLQRSPARENYRKEATFIRGCCKPL